MENTAPLWVFTPPVAANIARSASAPNRRRGGKSSGRGWLCPSRPAEAKRTNQLPRAAALD